MGLSGRTRSGHNGFSQVGASPISAPESSALVQALFAWAHAVFESRRR